MRSLESLDPEIQNFLQTEAPDLEIIEPRVALAREIESYDFGVFGEKNEEKTKKMINFIRNWLASPLFHDELPTDLERGKREELARDKYEETVHKFMLSGRSRPSRVTNVYTALHVLLDADANSGKNVIDPDERAKLKKDLDNIVVEYKVINTLEVDIHNIKDETKAKLVKAILENGASNANVLDESVTIDLINNAVSDTQAEFWKQLPDYFSDSEIDELQTSPRPVIRRKMEGLMKELESVALEILQKLPRKG